MEINWKEMFSRNKYIDFIVIFEIDISGHNKYDKDMESMLWFLCQ